MDNNNRVAHGRFLNVKPAVGLLTSTARTFIQEGVTTEYATQVLGTTLDHGRLYAQLISKSSRVLYNKNNVNSVIDSNSINPTTTISQNPFNQIPITQIVAHNSDNNNDTKVNDDENIVTFIKNTDYISPDRPSVVYPSTSTDVPNFSPQAPQYNFEFLPVSLAQVQENPFEVNAKVKESFSVSQSSSSSNNKGDVSNEKIRVVPDKVRSPIDLPTYTVKHDFTNYFWDEPDTDTYLSQQKLSTDSNEDDSDEAFYSRDNRFSFSGSPQAVDQQQNRIGKMLYRGGVPVGISNEIKPQTSVTYYGFADFTTVVGNTVIIFSPNTAAPPAIGQITSIKGEATLHNLATKVKSPQIKATPTKIKEILHTQRPHHVVNAIPVPNRKSKQDAEKQTTTTTSAPQEISGTTIIFEDEENDLLSTTPSLPTEENQKENSYEEKSSVLAKEQNPLQYDTTEDSVGKGVTTLYGSDVIEPSEVSVVSPSSVTSHTAMLSIPSSEDIAKIFASLAAKAASESSKSLTSSTEAEATSSSDTHVLGGATTIFFEDDPFLVATSTASTETDEKSTQLNPSATVTNVVFASTVTPQSTESAVTETTTAPAEESTETTVSPVTESNTVNDDQEANTTEYNVEAVTTKDKEDEAKHETEEQTIECPTGFVSNPSTAYKTLTYLTTFFIPTEDEESTTTSIQSNEVVQTDISYECSQTEKIEIKPTSITGYKNLAGSRTKYFGLNRNTEKPVVDTTNRETILKANLRNKLFNRFKGTTPPPTTTTSEKITTTEEIPEVSDTEEEPEDTGKAPLTEDKNAEHVSEPAHLPTTTTTESPVTEQDDDDEEIELIYKTLYTTYTYLTTFFHESTSSVSSRKQVITNIVTSTLDNSLINTDRAVADLVASMTDSIRPTSVGIGRPTTTFEMEGKSSIDEDEATEEPATESNLNEATPVLETSFIGNDVKTYYTTYTYFTTVFVDGETEISSRTEVYTNYVGQTIKPTKLVEDDKLFSTSVAALNKEYDTTLERKKSTADNKVTANGSSEDLIDNNVIQLSYSTMIRSSEPVESTTLSSDSDDEQVGAETTTIATGNSPNTTTTKMSTDVKSSSSNGDRHIIENVRKQFNNLLEDQISSESNNEEIMPSPTLLLQTSYTTFTYFTTMYLDNTASNVLSRLETITNVVTETLSPTQTIAAEDASLPITYFTTFTYWTTLFKEGNVVTTSREEVISNVVAPASTITPAKPDADVILATTIPTLTNAAPEGKALEHSENLITASVIEPTTYYTTYTYFTTSYVGDETVLNSRFETVTNIITPSKTVGADVVSTVAAVGRAINLDKNNANQIVNELVKSKNIAKDSREPSKSRNLVSVNQGKIVDAEGISTLFYTTKAIGTYINDLYTQVIESTSSISVDEEKKKAAGLTESPQSRSHKTGLVRLIDGTMIANSTTTLYQSRVIGTVIDNRYAQIIESTSSFVIDKTTEASIAPTVTQKSIQPTANVISPTPAVVESSLSDSHQQSEDEEEQGEEGEEGEEIEEEGDDDDAVDENGRKKSRLTFQTRKRTFTPVIRPFASRNRPTFNPKRKNLSPSSATIITRSDFTPTITATPAIKSEGSTRRFGGGSRRSSSNSPQPALASTSATPALGSSRRFSRPRSSISGSGPGSSLPGSTLTSSARIRPTSSRLLSTSGANNVGPSSRRSGNLFRPSSTLGGRLSVLPSQSRFRVNPTLASSLNRGGFASATPKSLAEQEEGTTIEPNEDAENSNDDASSDDAEEDIITTTTENSRRNQNPLLRFRRPLNAAGRSPVTSTPRPAASIPTRKSPLSQRSRATTQSAATTTTTARPKPRAFQRPAGLATLSNRPRAGGNGLFPPRGLFKPATQNQEAEKEEANSVGNEQNDGQETGNSEDNEEEEETNEDNGYTEEPEESDTDRDRRNSRPSGFSTNPKLAQLLRKRTKRQVDYGSRTSGYQSRYRRPSSPPQQISSRSYEENERDEEVEIEPPKPKIGSRYSARQRTTPTTHSPQPNLNSRIRPTKASAKQGRAQFTLRGSGTERESTVSSNTFSPASGRTSNFRNRHSSTNTNNYPQTSSVRRKPLPTSSARTKTSRLRTYGGHTTDSRSRSRSSGIPSSPTRPRTTSRARGRVTPDSVDYQYVPNFDGIITVTHQVPTEITIPIVNGHMTEYKNIITAKVSTEVLGPNQYSTTTRGGNGNSVLVLASELSSINNGATELTQFFLKETPTTTVIFTPTTIRGRKTSFSHIIPSTVYNVEQVVSTIQPQISANAPLANILLSQLLLGNLGIPQQQPNPLLGLAQPQPQPQAATPTTEFKVRTTTYVTTVTNAMSTVIPLTFRGKEILTTIVDSSVNVITATEFLTETVVVTPTPALAQPQQLNSLLLPLLLQQQAQQQQLGGGIANTATPQLFDTGAAAQSLFQDTLLSTDTDDRQALKGNKKIITTDIDDNEDIQNAEEYSDLEPYQNESREQPQKIIQKTPRYQGNKRKNGRPGPPTPALETSVVTLYVSGRKPGEFSTVLSTVVTESGSGSSLLQKRAIDVNRADYDVKSSELPHFIDIYNAEGSDIDEYILPAPANEINVLDSSQNDRILSNIHETQSLESIIGDVSKYIQASSLASENKQAATTLVKKTLQRTTLVDNLSSDIESDINLSDSDYSRKAAASNKQKKHIKNSKSFLY